MKSLLHVSRELKKLSIKYKHVVIYGAGMWGKSCKQLLDNCHIAIDSFVITKRIDEDNIGKEIDGIPVYCIDEFPFADDMKIENTLFVIAVSDRYIKEIYNELNKHLCGVNKYRYYMRETRRSLGGYGYPGDSKQPSIGITTVAGCKVNCSYCPQDVFLKSYCKNKSEMRLSLLEFQNILSNIPSEVWINFAGFSEPFLNDECKDMIVYAANKGHHVQVYTTLVGLTPEIIEDIYEYADFILHLPDEKNETNIVMNDEYLACLNKFIDKNKISKRIVYISAPMGVNSKLIQYIPPEIYIDEGYTDRAGHLDSGEKGECYGSLTCMRTYNRLDRNVLLPNGDLVLCCQDWGLKNILGNLKKNTYVDILDGEIASKIRKQMLDGKEKMLCHNCSFAIELIN